jgi:hypothetical protein
MKVPRMGGFKTRPYEAIIFSLLLVANPPQIIILNLTYRFED